MIRMLMEKYREGQKELHCVFVDLEKAYDRVPREELWYCMRSSGVAEKYVRVVQDMYERSMTVVRCAVGQTEEFKVEVGLHQGSALSPFLFAMLMDRLTDEVPNYRVFSVSPPGRRQGQRDTELQKVHQKVTISPEKTCQWDQRDVNMRRALVLLALPVYLHEDASNFFKTCTNTRPHRHCCGYLLSCRGDAPDAAVSGPTHLAD
ncbi:uncharacterized protein LOC144991892 [Oryzias latipes]